MAKVTQQDLDMVAVLSRLEVAEQDKEKYLGQLDAFLQYVDNLAALPTDDVEPLAHVLPIHNVFREDEVRPSLDRELALSNAPLKEDGYFKVPKILED